MEALYEIREILVGKPFRVRDLIRSNWSFVRFPALIVYGGHWSLSLLFLGYLLASETEREILEILGVPWQEPHERGRANLG